MSPKFSSRHHRQDSEIHRSPEASHHKPNAASFEVPNGLLNIQRHIGNSGVKRMLAQNTLTIQRSQEEMWPVQNQNFDKGGLVDPFKGQSNQNTSGGKSGQSITQGGLVDPFGTKSDQSIEQGGLVDPFANKSGQSITQGGLVDPFRDKWK